MQLEGEQYELLEKFVEAHRSTPRESRGVFIASETHDQPQATFLHSRVPDLTFEGSMSDADILADAGLLRKSYGSHGDALFAVLPKGIDACNRKNSSPPLDRVPVDSLRNSGSQGESVEGSAGQIPAEIKESLERFRVDHPDPLKVAFLMMRFGKTKAHENIVSGIRRALDPLGIAVVRADDKQYHDDLFPNVLTYVYGSGIGIAVFERIETEEFNPNVALEVGYMFALRKPVCLLKERTLKTLHADLVGKLYRVFDSLDPINTIPLELSQWLRDKGLRKGA